MAFFLTPRFAPSPAQHCAPFACAPRPSRRQAPAFAPFLSQVQGLLGELEREAHREHTQRQQQQRPFHARFDVRENTTGYEVEGEVPGFENENISVEVMDEYTLKIAGKRTSKAQTAAVPEASKEATAEENIDGATLAQDDARSEMSSTKSYQPTVEDDFEDLGAETRSTASSTHPKPESKDEKAVQPVQKVEPAPQQHQELLSERVHGSFERNFKFPERVDAEGVRARLRNGVLEVVVPKAAVPAVRRVVVQ